jgi:hypothetical protein
MPPDLWYPRSLAGICVVFPFPNQNLGISCVLACVGIGCYRTMSIAMRLKAQLPSHLSTDVLFAGPDPNVVPKHLE